MFYSRHSTERSWGPLSNQNLGYLEESLVGWLKLRWAEGRLMADSGSSLGCYAHDLSSQIPGTPAFCQV